MIDPPAGWTQATLGAICDRPQYGWTTSADNDVSKTTALKFLRTTDITRGRLDWETVPYCKTEPPRPQQYLLAPGDIVISRAGSVGFSYHLTDVKPAVFASYLIRFRPSQLVDGRYVAYFLQSSRYWQQVRAAAAGIALANVNAKKLAAVEVPLAPRAEQERVVAAIEGQLYRLDAAVAALERVRMNLKQVRAAVLKAACTGSLVPPAAMDSGSLLTQVAAERRATWGRHSKKPYKEPAAPHVFPLSIPDHWRVASLEALTDPVRVICYGILMPKHHIDDGIPYVRVKDMKGWTIDVAGLSRTSQEIANQYARASLRSGDLLLAIRGSFGRVAIIPPELDGANITQDSARIASHSALDRRYLLYYMGGSVANQYYHRVARGVAVKGVNIGDLRKMPVPVPPPDEQLAIADEVERQFSLLDEAEAAVVAQLRRSSSLRSSILAAGFSGKLVHQDPSDEPASVLLERIAAERASSDGQNPLKARSQHRKTVKA